LRRAARGAGTRIERITLAPIEGRFHKFVAMNSYDEAPKGHTYTNTLVRVATNQGVEGIGVMSYAAPDAAYVAALRMLVGANPADLYEMRDGRAAAPTSRHSKVLGKYPHLDGPLFDLIGKLTDRPVWKLLGDPVKRRVDAYDGTLYFSDLWFQDRGVRAVAEEAEEACRKGYRGVKLKAGRGRKWMDKAAGLRRDIAVIRAVREAVGPEVRIMVDPNNGYRDDFEGAWRLLEQTAEENLHFIEEPFPEDAAQYTELRKRMRRAGMKTMIADGENLTRAVEFEPFLKPNRLVDVMQLDIRTSGLLGNLEAARLGRPAGAACIPHNWGSQVGLFMALHLAKAVENVPMVEDDRSTHDVIRGAGYEFRDGMYTVPDSPGLSLKVDEDVYERKCKPRETVVS